MYQTTPPPADWTYVWIAFFVIYAMFVGLGIYVSGQKNRTSYEGFFLGLLFGPFGVLILALLPVLDAQERFRRDKFWAPELRDPAASPSLPDLAEVMKWKDPDKEPAVVVSPTPAMIRADCPGCHRRFTAPFSMAGKRCKCPACGGSVGVPNQA